MNRCFKVVFNRVRGCLVVANEFTRLKSKGKTAVVVSALAAASLGAVPLETVASGDDSNYVGNNANHDGLKSAAIGNNTQATGNYSTAVGNSAKATEEGAVALGYAASANSSNAVAIGREAKALYLDSVAIGRSTANGDYSVAIGRATAGDMGVAVGFLAKTTQSRGIAIGNYANTTGASALALGSSASASGSFSTALGGTSSASGYRSVAIGSDSEALEDDIVSFGNKTLQRRLIQIARGSADTDAVTVGQMKDYATKVTAENNITISALANPDPTNGQTYTVGLSKNVTLAGDGSLKVGNSGSTLTSSSLKIG